MAPRSPHAPVPDPISSASARLFAAGIDRRQRLVTLRFLGILLANAGDDGRIQCDPDDLVGLGLLHGLVPEEVTRGRLSLEAVGALERDPTGWLITDFAPVGDEVPGGYWPSPQTTRPQRRSHRWPTARPRSCPWRSRPAPGGHGGGWRLPWGVSPPPPSSSSPSW